MSMLTSREHTLWGSSALEKQTSKFFFSSRRRHTSWPRDWSSDVCSSDLTEVQYPHRLFGSLSPPQRNTPATPVRSEERRVGKECGSRWTPEQEKIGQETRIAATGSVQGRSGCAWTGKSWWSTACGHALTA